MRPRPTFLFVLLISIAPCRASAAEPLVDQVRMSIEKGIRWMRDTENGKGSFEQSFEIAHLRPGGATALAVVALLQAGVPKDDAMIVRCLKYLRGVAPSQTYTVGLQTMAFCLAGYKEDDPLIQRNLDWLANNRTRSGWGYTANDRSPDHSINQYALLGVHEAHLRGFKIDADLLKEMNAYYLASGPAGQWWYRDSRKPTLTMTTAGVCNLLITAQDMRKPKPLDKRGIDPKCGEYAEDVVVSRALRWIGAVHPNDFQRDASIQHIFYCLYGIERTGRLTGERFFGEHDWYRVGCEYLVKEQQQNGSWKGSNSLDRWPPISTSFALLFLSKGRTPVLISKLAHGNVDAKGATEIWNHKRSDARNLVEFCSRELFERQPVAWQVFDTRKIENRKARELAEDLLQSPIVYITGQNLKDIVGKRDEEMLKAFLDNGGFILGHACCGGSKENDKGVNFDTNFRDLIKRLTGSDLTPLGAGHPVSKASGKFNVNPEDFGLEGVNVGCKTVVMYIREPISAWWENNDLADADCRKAFQMGANIVAYATGMQIPRPRLTEVEIVQQDEGRKPPRGYLQTAQLVSRREDLPLAPKAIPNLMAELGKLQMEVDRSAKKLTLTSPELLRFKFLYMHDRAGIRVPTPEALESLRFTLEHDGILLADAACGSKAFDKSFRDLMQALWPKDKFPDRQLTLLDPKKNREKNELYSEQVNGRSITTVKCRREEKDGTPSREYKDVEPELEGIKINGRWAVIYSKYDIGCALEKHQATDCLGHDHDSAKMLARAVVLYALRR